MDVDRTMVRLRNLMFQNGSECSKPISVDFSIRPFFMLLGVLRQLNVFQLLVSADVGYSRR